MPITKRFAYTSNELQLLNQSLSFIVRKYSLLSATRILSRSPTAYNSTVSLDKITRTDYVDFGKCQDRFGQFSWSKNASIYVDVKLNVFRKNDNNEFRLVQNVTMRETEFNQFWRLGNQLVLAAGSFAREENLSSVLIPSMSIDMDEQLKLAHKVVDVVDRANRQICVTLLRYDVDKPDSSYAQVQFFARKKEDEKFHQVVFVKYIFEDFIYLLDVMNSVYDKVITNQPICNFL